MTAVSDGRLIIDITQGPIAEAPFIWITKDEPYDAACRLERGPDNHERCFGCYLKTDFKTPRSLEVLHVEHALKIIEALQIAIKEHWLFTKKEIAEYATSATTTREKLNKLVRRERE